ncbi:hypothetical protein OC834_001709 [Tilletia horrida]|nr:hypothetical protein OC834_001709 [Tilletia horrida]
MFGRRSTQVRRRNAFRADKARSQRTLGGGRSILDIAFCGPHGDHGQSKGKEKQPSDADTATTDARCLEAIRRHIFTHSLDVVLPLPNLSAQEADSRANSTTLFNTLASQDSQLASLLQSLGQASSAPLPATFHLARVPLALFLSPEFVTGFIRNGSLIALSVPFTNEDDDTIALDGQGILTLSLSRETYQTLGLVGRQSRFHRGPSGRMGDRSSGTVNRFIVELPLASASFVPGKKGYERALACLKAWDWDRASKMNVQQESHGEGSRTRLVSTDIGAGLASDPSGTGSLDANATWQMLFAWSPPIFADSSNPTPVAAQKPVVFPKTLVNPQDVHELSAPLATRVLPDIWIPSLRHPSASTQADLSPAERELIHRAEPTLLRALQQAEPEKGGEGGGMEEVHEAVQALAEWSGLACLNSESIRTYSRPNSLVDTTHVATPRWAGTILHLSWRGLLTPHFCASVVKQVQAYLDSALVTSAVQQHHENGTKAKTASKTGGVSAATGIRGVDQSHEAPTDKPWASVLATGFEHAPLSWSSAYPGQGTALGSGIALASARTGSRLQGQKNRKVVKKGDFGPPEEQEEEGVVGEEDGNEEEDAEMEEGASSDSNSSDDDDDDDDSASDSDSEEEEEDEHRKHIHASSGARPTSSSSAKQKAQARKKNVKQRERRKRKRKSHVRRGEAEHGRGRSGWTVLLLGRRHAEETAEREDADQAGGMPRYVLVEDVGLDTRQ